MKDAFDFEDDNEDSLVDHFDSDFLNEVPTGDGVDELDFNGLQSNQMYRGDGPVYDQGKRIGRGGPSQPVRTQDPWQSHPMGPPLPRAPYVDTGYPAGPMVGP